MLMISPERRILILLAGMIAGIALVLAGYGSRDLRLAGVMAAAALWLGSVIRMRRTGLRLDQARPLAVVTQMAGAGVMLGGLAAWLQMAQAPESQLEDGFAAVITGEISRIDGRSDGRLRFWIRLTAPLDAPEGAGQLRDGALVRVSYEAQTAERAFRQLAGHQLAGKPTGDRENDLADDPAHDLADRTEGDRTLADRTQAGIMAGFGPGDLVQVRVRLYPPPGSLLPGAPDFALQARARGVVASGYVVRFLAVQPGPDRGPWLARFRQEAADRLVTAMQPPAGGIAAALLVGDRRHVNQQVYDMFQRSGLAHLLAISGLHMGLLCFGVIQLLRFGGAWFPGWATRLALHKYAAVAGLVAGASYVLLAGMPISALRAFIMAGLLIAAVLLDRLALTLRNVALAAMIILAINPVAVFTASFQLSFAATAALVLWYEARLRRPGDAPASDQPRTAMARPLRYLVALLVTSLIAAAATLPFAAQHFGLVTIWGVAANLLGIPLTGLWIMPAGLLVGLGQLAGSDAALAAPALWMMETGILALVAVARLFADLPYAGWRVLPPGYAALCLGLGGWLLALLDARQAMARLAVARCGGEMVMLGALVMWVLTPAPDGVLLARGRTPILVLAGPNGQATPLGPSTRDGMLSDFTESTASLLLAQEITDPARGTDALTEPTMTNNAGDRRRPVMLQGRHGQTLAVARHRAVLTRACRSGADLVLSFAAPRYDCRVPVFTVSRLRDANFLLLFNGDGSVTVRPSSADSRRTGVTADRIWPVREGSRK